MRSMTSVQLRYTGPATGLDWLVKDLHDADLDPVFPPIDPPFDDVEVIVHIARTGPEPRPRFSDPGGLEVIDRVLAGFNKRFVTGAVPDVEIVGVQSDLPTTAAVVLKNPSLAQVTDVETEETDQSVGGEMRRDRRAGSGPDPGPVAMEENPGSTSGRGWRSSLWSVFGRIFRGRRFQ